MKGLLFTLIAYLLTVLSECYSLKIIDNSSNDSIDTLLNIYRENKIQLPKNKPNIKYINSPLIRISLNNCSNIKGKLNLLPDYSQFKLEANPSFTILKKSKIFKSYTLSNILIFDKPYHSFNNNTLEIVIENVPAIIANETSKLKLKDKLLFSVPIFVNDSVSNNNTIFNKIFTENNFDAKSFFSNLNNKYYVYKNNTNNLDYTFLVYKEGITISSDILKLIADLKANSQNTQNDGNKLKDNVLPLFKDRINIYLKKGQISKNFIENNEIKSKNLKYEFTVEGFLKYLETEYPGYILDIDYETLKSILIKIAIKYEKMHKSLDNNQIIKEFEEIIKKHAKLPTNTSNNNQNSKLPAYGDAIISKHVKLIKLSNGTMIIFKNNSNIYDDYIDQLMKNNSNFVIETEPMILNGHIVLESGKTIANKDIQDIIMDANDAELLATYGLDTNMTCLNSSIAKNILNYVTKLEQKLDNLEAKCGDINEPLPFIKDENITIVDGDVVVTQTMLLTNKKNGVKYLQEKYKNYLRKNIK